MTGCRLKRMELGLPYAKSGCTQCGSAAGAARPCTEKAVLAPAALVAQPSPATAVTTSTTTAGDLGAHHFTLSVVGFRTFAYEFMDRGIVLEFGHVGTSGEAAARFEQFKAIRLRMDGVPVDPTLPILPSLSDSVRRLHMAHQSGLIGLS